MDVNTPEAWIAAPILVSAGVALVLARNHLGDRFAKHHARVRDRVSLLSSPNEPVWLRPMVPIVGTIWVLCGLVILGLLLVG